MLPGYSNIYTGTYTSNFTNPSTDQIMGSKASLCLRSEEIAAIQAETGCKFMMSFYDKWSMMIDGVYSVAYLIPSHCIYTTVFPLGFD